MKIAILGIRGIPVSYSGFETCAEELSIRFLDHGHQVSVYCRKSYQKSGLTFYKGVKLIVLPTFNNKYLETFIHTLLSTVHVIFTDVKVVQYFGVGNAIFTLLPRAFGKRTYINVDGLDWTRKKWPFFAKLYLKLSARLATFFATAVITDSKNIAEYYKKEFKKSTDYIPYGVTIASSSENAAKTLAKFGIEKDKYILFVGRFVPENNIHYLIHAYNKINTNLKLVIGGGGVYEKDYIESLKKDANENVVFTGFLGKEDYRDLCCNAYLFVEPTEASGTHPAILDAMGYGNCVLANNIPTNLEVISDAGLSYDGSKNEQDLRNKLEWLIANREIVEQYRPKAIEHVKKNYSWEEIVDRYLTLYLEN